MTELWRTGQRDVARSYPSVLQMQMWQLPKSLLIVFSWVLTPEERDWYKKAAGPSAIERGCGRVFMLLVSSSLQLHFEINCLIAACFYLYPAFLLLWLSSFNPLYFVLQFWKFLSHYFFWIFLLFSIWYWSPSVFSPICICPLLSFWERVLAM